MNTYTTQTGAEIPAAHNFKTLVVIYPADAAYLTEKQREIIKSFDSREAIIKRQVELVKKLQQRGAVEALIGKPLPLPTELLEELAAINVYLTLQAL